MKILTKFTTKKGRVVEIVEPTTELLDEILEFVKKLSKEDTFLSFHPGQTITRDEEEKWLMSQIAKIKNGSSLLFWAIFEDKIIGSVDVNRGRSVRDWHIGTIGLMVDKDFRREGIGGFLLNLIFKKAKELGVRTVSLDVFSDNEAGRVLYQKLGFKEWGRLPDGFYRQKKFSDRIYMYKNL